MKQSRIYLSTLALATLMVVGCNPDVPSGTVCGDNTCGEGQKCDEATMTCVAAEPGDEDKCKDVTCDEGKTCNKETGKCEGGTVTPEPKECDPACDVGFVCVDGSCEKAPDVCTGINCDEGKSCIAVNDKGTCVDNECIEGGKEKTCEAGKTCSKGECVDDGCESQTCGSDETCVKGICKETACLDKSCDSGMTCKGGECVYNACLDAKCDADEICTESGDCIFAVCKDKTCDAGKICDSNGNCVFEVAPELIVTAVGNDMTTDENGKKAAVQVALSQPPTADVTVSIEISNAAEAQAVCDNAPCTLVFNASNWNQPQAFTIAGIDDDAEDGDQNYSVSFKSSSSDNDFNNLTKTLDGFVNKDIGVSAVSVILDYQEGSMTSENGGKVEIKVSLSAQPEKDVTFTVASDKETEGTVNVSSLTFTPANWNVPQTITVSGVADNTIDDEGNNVYHIVFGDTVSEDQKFNGLHISPIELLNIDVDKAGLALSSTSIEIDEAELTSSIGIKLSQKPSSEVICKAVSKDVTEAVIEEGEVVFDSNNWDSGFTFVVKGVQDNEIDGDQNFQVALSCDSRQDAYKISGIIISGVCHDTTVAGVTAIADTTALSESGTEATVSIALTAIPAKDVKIKLSLSDDSELAFVDESQKELTFTAANWKDAQEIKVKGIQDFLIDGTQTSKLQFEVVSDDDHFKALSVDPISFTVEDIDVAEIVITGDDKALQERPIESAEFSVVLSAKPTKNVEISLSSSDKSELILADDSNLIFTTDNWNVPQTVKVMSYNDGEADGNQEALIKLKSKSGDAYFHNMTANSPSYTIVDADTAGLVIVASNTTITNLKNEAQFSIQLQSAPSSDVVILFSSSNKKLAEVKGTLTFDKDNYNKPQIVKVTHYGFEQLDDTVTITFQTASSSDVYNGIKETRKLRLIAFESQDFPYTGKVQEVKLYPGEYQLEVWGAQGAMGYKQAYIGGPGGYSTGLLTLTKEETLYVYVGGKAPDRKVTGGWNGGANAADSNDHTSGGGGGATDISLEGTKDSTDWKFDDHFYSRIIVAGGGGGGGENDSYGAGFGGGVEGGTSKSSGPAGTLTSGADFGFGWSCFNNKCPGDDNGGGGGGWYGGQGGGIGVVFETYGNDGDGAGGSGWVYTEENYNAWKETTEGKSGKWLLTPSFYLKEAKTIAGDKTFASPSGVSEVGHRGDGYARITRVAD